MLSYTVVNGRLVKDPVLKQKEKNGKKIKWSYYRLAVNRDQGEEADFINCVAFGCQAEFAKQYMKQGTRILVVGRIRSYSYEDRLGNRVQSAQLLIYEQGLCGNWIRKPEDVSERIFSHAQDFPVILPEDLEMLVEYEQQPILT